MTYANCNKTVLFNYNQNGNLPGRYITAAICNVLGYSNQCFVLTEMRNFGEKIPESGESRSWLFAYDMLEPIIAEKIEEEYATTQDKNTWTQIYNLFLSEIAGLMGAQKYHEALGNYQQLMGVLKKYFEIDDIDLPTYLQDSKASLEEYGIAQVKLPAEKILIEK